MKKLFAYTLVVVLYATSTNAIKLVNDTDDEVKFTLYTKRKGGYFYNCNITVALPAHHEVNWLTSETITFIKNKNKDVIKLAINIQIQNVMLYPRDAWKPHEKIMHIDISQHSNSKKFAENMEYLNNRTLRVSFGKMGPQAILER